MLAVLALFAFVSIPTVQSRSSGLNCLEQNHQGGKSCDGGICFRAWESPKGNDESYFCAKSSSDKEKTEQTMMPLFQKIQATSETVTIKVGIDLDGTVARIDGTMDPKT